ncbi:MAG TPA: DUF4012 domain-containing protein [Candidatus Nitrosocosmicus sp.]|nr:DUF4012 domain-containing protein [Candidatus Nitrosocosmicus sp.]
MRPLIRSNVRTGGTTVRSKRNRVVQRNALLFGIVFLLIIFTGGFFFAYLPYTRIKTKGIVVMKSAKQVSAAFKSNDIDEVKKNVQILEKDYEALKKEAKSVYWMSYIPFLGSYVGDFKNGIAAGDSSLQAGSLAVDAIEPYADLIGFKKGDNFFDKSADDRLETAVLTLDKVLVKVDDISNHIDDAREHIDKIDHNRYPKKFAGREIQSKVKAGKDQFDGLASLFVDAKPLLKKLPDILGSKEPKTYLLIFQNDKELRPTGGFLTAYAIFKVDKGRFKVVKSTDIYNLDATIANHPPSEPIVRTTLKQPKQFIRDSNLSPDFIESMKLFESLYQKSGEKEEYDGIITMDTHVLVDTLEILGPTSASGIEFKADHDDRCDCPQVIYELLNEIDRPVNYIKTNRKGLLGDLMYEIMQKALKSSPSQYWGRLSQVFMDDLQRKHILVKLEDKNAQQAIEKLNFAGRIQPFDGDYLHINDANFAGAKTNLFIEQSVISNTETKNGTTERTITIKYKNPHNASDCNLERGGLCLNAPHKGWLRIYVPQGSKLVDFKGSTIPTKTYNSLGKTVFEGLMNINPQGTAQVIVTYTLPPAVDSKNLLIQKQPGTEGNLYIIEVNGSKKQEFSLITDKVVKL